MGQDHPRLKMGFAGIDHALPAPIDSCTHMKTQRALLLVGSFWELVRFFLMLLLLAQLLGSVAGAGTWMYPWLLMVGSGNLLIAGGEVMLALIPDRYAGLPAFLRLGKSLSVFSFFLLFVSGAARIIAGQQSVVIAGIGIPPIAVLMVVFILDLLSLAVLLLWRGGGATRRDPPAGPELPEYRETEVDNYH